MEATTNRCYWCGFAIEGTPVACSKHWREFNEEYSSLVKGYDSKVIKPVEEVPKVIARSSRDINRVCTVEGCGKEYKAKGYCRAHYHEFKRVMERNALQPK